MKFTKSALRRLHRVLAPIMLLPIVLTLITGTVYQLFDSTGQGDSVDWLLDLHKGNFGLINLEAIYPYFNALGLLTLAVTGVGMWLQSRHTSTRRTYQS